MGNTFRQYAVGDKPQFAASQVNAWTNAARSHQQNKRPLQGGSPRHADSTRVPVSNDTGADRPPFSVLKLSKPGIDPVIDESEYLSGISFTGETITEDDTDSFAITQQFLPGSVEEPSVVDPGAIISGMTFVRLTGDAGLTNATPKIGKSAMQAEISGPCVILYDPGPAGEERIACVKIGGGSSSKCTQWWFLQLFPGAGGIATDGDFKLDYTAIDEDNNGASGSITVPYDIGFVEFGDLLKTQPALVDSDSVLVLKTKGGPLERVAIAIGNRNATEQRILTLDWSDNTLDSGQPYIIPWRPS